MGNIGKLQVKSDPLHPIQIPCISESACFRNCRWIEDTIMKSRKLSLPGKKALLKSDNKLEVILIDASESPVERPKKKSKK